MSVLPLIGVLAPFLLFGILKRHMMDDLRAPSHLDPAVQPDRSARGPYHPMELYVLR